MKSVAVENNGNSCCVILKATMTYVVSDPLLLRAQVQPKFSNLIMLFRFTFNSDRQTHCT